MPAYVIFSDATLQAIADTRPVTREELARVPGVGAVKLDRHGAAVLAICAEPGGQFAQAARTPAGTGQPADVDARTGP